MEPTPQTSNSVNSIWFLLQQSPCQRSKTAIFKLYVGHSFPLLPIKALVRENFTRLAWKKHTIFSQKVVKR
jgi:hypothetical protein